jgi:hypothetical protein
VYLNTPFPPVAKTLLSRIAKSVGHTKIGDGLLIIGAVNGLRIETHTEFELTIAVAHEGVPTSELTIL